MRTVLIATGGTGGHVFPAIALSQKLTNQQVHFAGGRLARYLNDEPHTEITAGRRPGAIFKGIWQSIKLLRKLRPNVVIGFGSFYCFPVLCAAVLLRIPIILHEGNAIGGKVNRWFALFAKMIFTHFPKVDRLPLKKCNEIEPLLRAHIQKHSKKEARAALGLEDCPTLLVFGGSQGASAINQTLLKLLPSLKYFQIIHLTGSDEDLTPYYSQHGISSYIRSFEPRMDLVWSAADVAVTRAGASTLSEQRFFNVPTVFIPFPSAADNHQQRNAEQVVDRRTNTALLLESELTPAALFSKIGSIYQGLDNNLGLEA